MNVPTHCHHGISMRENCLRCELVWAKEAADYHAKQAKMWREAVKRLEAEIAKDS